ncbi:hypothetical protein evm_002091 [Chilo suppressalis]|nr:hypothetical protein evm_002091 [Chilo suppressalis]
MFWNDHNHIRRCWLEMREQMQTDNVTPQKVMSKTLTAYYSETQDVEQESPNIELGEKIEIITENFDCDDNSSTDNVKYQNSFENCPENQIICEIEQVEESSPMKIPKILIQRVFHQAEKHIVEKKLDFVIADTDKEITKHVFGGLFNTRYYPYMPENYCKKHSADLYEYHNEDLPKIGDKFDSHNSFRLYIDSKAKEWKYYLKCADSHRKNGMDTFVYKCVFARPRHTISRAKGLRKRTRKIPLHDCPCRVLLKPIPKGAKDLTVIYVCNHHDHPLTDEYFYKLQHGRRLHPSVKEELMDLLSLDVDRELLMRYFESLTGYNMSYKYFTNMIIYMKKHKIERHFSVEKLQEMTKKIDKMKEEFGIPNENEYHDNPDNDFTQTDPMPKDAAEVSFENLNNNSRLETRLQQLKHDEETLQNIKHLQDSVRTENNPWNGVHMYVESKQSSSGDREQHSRSPHLQRKINTCVSSVEEQIEKSTSVKTPQSENDFYYEIEVTVDRNTRENEPECVNYENSEMQIDFCQQNFNSDENVTYCIQYEDNKNLNEDSNEFYGVLNNLENRPLQIEATKLAMVNITPNNNQGIRKYDLVAEIQPDLNTVSEVQVEHRVDNIVEVIEEPSGDGSLDLGKGEIYEIIETNNKKILPDRDFVRTTILNKHTQMKSCEQQQKSNLNTSETQRNGTHNRNDSNINAKESNKYKFGKRRRKRKTNIECNYGDLYSDSSKDLFKMDKVVKKLSQYNVDIKHLKDDEYYVIVVDNFKKSTKITTDKVIYENLDEKNDVIKFRNNTTTDEHSYSDLDEKNDVIKFRNNTTTDEHSYSGKCNIDKSIHKLQTLKKSLKAEVKNLFITRTKLMHEISEVKINKKEIDL